MTDAPIDSPNSWKGRFVGEHDRYRLEKYLGGGGMGDVYLATDTRLGKSVALKLLKASLAIAADQDARKRFEWECAIAAALASEHIVQVSDYGITAEGSPFYVMEYLQGQTLGQFLTIKPQLSVEQTLQIIIQVCAGLKLAHQGIVLQGVSSSEPIKVVHRDLKPANIFLVPTALGELVKLIDFGIAKIRSLQSEETRTTGAFLGTYHYAAPEQFEGSQGIDERTDIYSLGMILYEMLAGTDAFGLGYRQNGVSEEAWISSHLVKEPIPLRSQAGNRAISPELEAVVMRCLEKAPEQRFSSVEALMQALKTASLSSTDAVPQIDPSVISAQASSQTIAPPQNQPNAEQLAASSLTPSAYSRLTPEQYTQLEEVLSEFVGVISPRLLSQESTKAVDFTQLLDNLSRYVREEQKAEFEQMVLRLLPESTVQNNTQTAATQLSVTQATASSQTLISEDFLMRCEQELVEIIGPIGRLLIRKAKITHSNASIEEMIDILAAGIPDSKKAAEFRDRLSH